MALGGAWVRTVAPGLGGGNRVRFLGRTFAADADAAILGLDGDAGADTGFTMPAGWPPTGGETLTAAQQQSCTHVIINETTSPVIGATGVSAYTVVRGTAPWRITFTLRGTPTGVVTPEIDIIFAHSSVR